jgi:hypothetical protein
MILSFKTKFPNGEPTDFVISIVTGTKKHTIRKGKRWQAGYFMHMAIGVRTSNYYQFNADLEPLQRVKSTQEILITYYAEMLQVLVDGRYLYWNEIEILIENDGLTREQFINWFFPKGEGEFSGQIIHWTDLKY